MPGTARRRDGRRGHRARHDRCRRPHPSSPRRQTRSRTALSACCSWRASRARSTADIDTNNDGTFDTTPWTSIVDGVAVNDGGAGDVTYVAAVARRRRTTASRSRPAARRASRRHGHGRHGRLGPQRLRPRGHPGVHGDAAVAVRPTTRRAPRTPWCPRRLGCRFSDVASRGGCSGTTTFQFTVSLGLGRRSGRRDVRHRDRGRLRDAPSDFTATVADRPDDPGRQHDATRSTSWSTATRPPRADETFFVNVTNVVGAAVSDAQGQGTISNDDAARHADPRHPGHAARRLPTGTFTIEGIVVGDYQTQGSGQLRGFFVQEEDADVDADSATSEGIFVFCATCPTAGRAWATGSASSGASSEFFDMSQLTATRRDERHGAQHRQRPAHPGRARAAGARRA